MKTYFVEGRTCSRVPFSVCVSVPEEWTLEQVRTFAQKTREDGIVTNVAPVHRSVSIKDVLNKVRK